LTWAILIFAAYLIGSTPTAYLAVRLLKGQDIWRLGDGNAGAGNVFRTISSRAGIAVATIDIGKGAAAVLLVRGFLAEVLTSLGWLVTDAADGREALAKLGGQSYDLVLADIILPDVAGWEVARAARAQEPPPAIILLSGWIEPDDPALMQSGADAFLQKPVQVPDLVQTVREVLAKRRPPAPSPGASFIC
jgi:CheY-like chemotaxis protein